MGSARFLAFAFIASALPALAQSLSPLPVEIKGHWSWSERNITQIFALTSIKTTGTDSALAMLTWWTANTKCALREVPVQLRVSGPTISFDATTKCDVSFTAELTKGPSGWTGKAITQQGPVVTIEAE